MSRSITDYLVHILISRMSFQWNNLIQALYILLLLQVGNILLLRTYSFHSLAVFRSKCRVQYVTMDTDTNMDRNKS